MATVVSRFRIELERPCDEVVTEAKGEGGDVGAPDRPFGPKVFFDLPGSRFDGYEGHGRRGLRGHQRVRRAGHGSASTAAPRATTPS